MEDNIILIEPIYFTKYDNFVLIDGKISNYDYYLNNCNSNTLPIVFNYGNRSNMCIFNKETIEFLNNKYKEIEECYTIKENLKKKQKNMIIDYLEKNQINKFKKLCIISNNSFLNSNKNFLDFEPYFIAKDLDAREYSENLKFLIDFIKNYNIEHIDFYIPNINNEWNKYLDIIQNETKITIGISDGNNINIKYDGDWLIDNTSEKIINPYFSLEIEKHLYTLKTTNIIGISGKTAYIRQNENNIQYKIGNISENWIDIVFPCTITNNQIEPTDFFTVELLTNINLTNYADYFIFSTDNIILDGKNNNVITSVSNYCGLVNNGSIITSGFSNTKIRNVKLTTTDKSTLEKYNGWIAQSYYSNNACNNTIENCSSNGLIDEGCGGIIGSFASFNSGSCSIINCYSSGAIFGECSGGISGAKTASKSGNCLIKDCYSSGTISGNASGGIASTMTGAESGNVIIENCYSIGSICGIFSSGISSVMSGSFSGSCIIINCYSVGSISGANSGGIAGLYVGCNSGSCIIKNCSSLGSISGNFSGGIVANGGSDAGSIIITNCFSNGVMSGNYSCGIAGNGNGSNSSSCIITNCYSSGSICGYLSSGIAGYNSGTSSGSCIIKNCYSSGKVCTNNGGITISTDCTILDCYVSDGKWTYSQANENLDPETVPLSKDGILNPLGSVWAKIDNFPTPYLFSNFGSQVYSIPNATINKGESTPPAIDQYYYIYKIIAILDNVSSNYPFILIDSTTGSIKCELSSESGTYKLQILAMCINGNYSTTTFILTIT